MNNTLFKRIAGRAIPVKFLVVSTFSLLWLVALVVRSRGTSGHTEVDASWQMGLAYLLQQGEIAGRDFHFTYGPAGQALSWLAIALTSTHSAFDSYTLMVLLFSSMSVLLTALILVLIPQLSWTNVGVIYLASALPNLFLDAANFRVALVMLCAVLIFRAITATNRSKQIAWAVVAGLTIFVAQLVTPELALYALLAMSCAFLAASLAARFGYLKSGARSHLTLFMATSIVFVACNAVIEMWFRSSSVTYLSWNYLYYSLETMRGYQAGMGMDWELAPRPTLALGLLAVYTFGRTGYLVRRAPPREAVLLFVLGIASLIQLKSAFVRSGTGHILQATIPMVFLFLLMHKSWLSEGTGRSIRLRYANQIVWILMWGVLVLNWPATSLAIPRELLSAATGRVSVPETFQASTSISTPPGAVLPLDLLKPHMLSRPSVPMLVFPYQNYIAILLKRPLVAPVLQSYGALTEELQRFYVAEVKRRAESGLDVVYGLDDVASWPIDGIQAVTRMPIIFDYLYRHFELYSPEQAASGFYLLQSRSTPRPVALQKMSFKMERKDRTSGELRLETPVLCGLVRLDLLMRYPPTQALTRPAGLQLTFRAQGRPLQTSHLLALETDVHFTTYISLVPAPEFYRMFGSAAVPAREWDSLSFEPADTDALGTAPGAVEIGNIECVDRQRFIPAGATRPVTQLDVTPEMINGSTETGYFRVTPDSGVMPVTHARITRLKGMRQFAEVSPPLLASSAVLRLESVAADEVGIAIANPDDRPASVAIQLEPDRGAPFGASIQLRPRAQAAQLLGELIPFSGRFSGVLHLDSPSPVSALALRLAWLELTAMPFEITIGESAAHAASAPAIFPQFVSRGGWATELFLSNNVQSTITGRVDFFSPSGEPLMVALNGLRSSSFSYSIEPGTTFVLAPGER